MAASDMWEITVEWLDGATRAYRCFIYGIRDGELIMESPGGSVHVPAIVIRAWTLAALT